MFNRRMPLTAISLLLASSSAVHGADCFDDQKIGLFTERHYSELDAATRDRASDPKIDHLAKTALRSTRADVISIKADSKEAALSQARGEKLAVLAFISTSRPQVTRSRCSSARRTWSRSRPRPSFSS